MVDVWPKNPQNSRALDLKYRFNWTFPIVISPHDNNKVYVTSQVVHMTTDGGRSWRDISPDLSLANEEHLLDSGGLTFDNLGVEYGDLIFAFAESPLEAGLLWAGTNDGQVQVSRDGGANWTNVTGNIEGMPPMGTVSNIHASSYDAGTAYFSMDYHQMNGRDPHIYKTEDYGQSWKFISGDIPKSVFSYVHCVREDPKRKGLLYAGTENAAYVSFNDGAKWMPLQNNLPHAPVHWLEVQDNFNDLRDRHLRSRLLHHGRPHALPAAHPGDCRLRCSSLRAASGVPLPGGEPSLELPGGSLRRRAIRPTARPSTTT